MFDQWQFVANVKFDWSFQSEDCRDEGSGRVKEEDEDGNAE